MAMLILKYTLMIKTSIRNALKSGAISTQEDEYLHSMAKSSDTTTSTVALINDRGAPDFLYAALYFSTNIWALGEAVGRDADACAGYKFAQFLLSQEAPAHQPCWAARLLREFYDAHTDSMQARLSSAA